MNKLAQKILTSKFSIRGGCWAVLVAPPRAVTAFFPKWHMLGAKVWTYQYKYGSACFGCAFSILVSKVATDHCGRESLKMLSFGCDNLETLNFSRESLDLPKNAANGLDMSAGTQTGMSNGDKSQQKSAQNNWSLTKIEEKDKI